MIEIIPDEILEGIFEFITSPKDLKSVCLVNKRFDALARRLLWRKPNLKKFTMQDFRWISGMPIEILDIGELEIFELQCDGYLRWMGCSSLDGHSSALDGLSRVLEAHASAVREQFRYMPFAIEFFKIINQMDHLNHLKLDLSFVNVEAHLWSKLLDRCRISCLTVLADPKNTTLSGTMDLMNLHNFSKKHLPYLRYLESVIFEVDLVRFDIYKSFDDLKMNLKNVDRKQSPEVPKSNERLQNLSIKVLNIESDKYSNLFQTLDNFSGLKTLHMSLRIDNTCDFHETEFMKVKSEFILSHPQCQVWLEMDIDDSVSYNSWSWDSDDGW